MRSWIFAMTHYGGAPGSFSGAMGIYSWVPCLRCLIRRIGGARSSRAFGGAPEFDSTTTSGHGIRPRVLIVSTNVGVALFLLSVR